MIKYILLSLLMFFILCLRDVYSLEVDYFDIQQTNDFRFKFVDDSFFRIYKLRDPDGISFYLLFSSVDFESNSTCSGVCVYLLKYVDNRTGRLSTPFTRVKKAVLRERAISFDAVKVGNNHFYLFVLGQDSELRVYTIRVDGLRNEFLNVGSFFRSKMSSHVDDRVIVPYDLDFGKRGHLVNLFHETEDDKNKKRVIRWYRFDITKKRLDYVTEVSFDVNYEVLGLSYYLIEDEPFFILIDKGRDIFLKSRHCEVKMGFVPFFVLRDKSTRSNVLLFVIDYLHIPRFCSGLFYNVNREFHKLISFCPNIDKIRYSLNNRGLTPKLFDVYVFDLTMCSLKEKSVGIDKVNLFGSYDSVFLNVLGGLKPFKNVDVDNEVLLYETRLGEDVSELILMRLIK